jgi:hypothetical protein
MYKLWIQAYTFMRPSLHNDKKLNQTFHHIIKPNSQVGILVNKWSNPERDELKTLAVVETFLLLKLQTQTGYITA